MTTNLVLFNGVDASGKAGLWVTDGTSAGTWELSVAGSAFSNSVPTGPQYITAFGSEVLFEGEDPSHFEDLWVTDGTSPGTLELAVPGVDWQFGLQPRWLTVFGSEVLFDGTETNHRSGLWVTDGTVAGTSEISVAGANPNGLAPSHFTVFGNKVLFLGGGTGSGAANSGVWVTNGTSAGTSELSIAGAYSGGLFGLSSPPPNFAALGNKVLFQGWDAQIRSGLWVTDGTSAGTSEIVAGLAGGIDPTDLTTFGSEVLFNGTGPDNGVFNHRLLFVSDGTSAGTSQIPVAGAGSGGVDPTDLTVFGNKVLFGGVDVGGHRNLWITDGTAVSTSEIPVLRAASSGLGPSNFVVFGSEVLFNGIDAADHNGLWVTDGTSAGTSEIAVAGAGTNGLNPSHFAVFSQTLVRPVLSNIPVTDVFAARGPAITLAPSLHVTDPNSTVLVGATVSISGGTFANDGEVLTAVTSGTSITANYDSATETLTLTGTDSISDYQQVLDSVTFGSTSQNPTNFLSNSTRTLTWVVNDGSASNSLSTAETTTISISHSPPSLSGVAANVGFTEGGTAVTLSPTLVVVDQDSLTLVSAAL
jgi:ELWxxDGT repeat protein